MVQTVRGTVYLPLLKGRGLAKSRSCPTTPTPPTPRYRRSSTAWPRCRRAAISSASNASPNSARALATRKTSCRAPSTSRAPTAGIDLRVPARHTRSAGRRVHAYTSPHLVRFNERIRLAGTLIDDVLLAALLEVLDRAADLQASFLKSPPPPPSSLSRASPPTIASSRWPRRPPDATNIIPAPAVCGIASLGIDHEAFLLAPEDGVPAAAIERIAWEKTGIFQTRRGASDLGLSRPCNEARQDRAAAVGGTVFAEGNDWAVEPARDGFTGPPDPSIARCYARAWRARTKCATRGSRSRCFAAPPAQPTDDDIAKGVAAASGPGGCSSWAKGR